MIPDPDYSESDSSSKDLDDSDDDDDLDEDEVSTDSNERLRELEEEDEDWEEDKRKRPSAVSATNVSDSPSRLHSADDLLIKPKKLVNPYLADKDRQSLHKELRFSQKYGTPRSNKKSELQIVLEKYSEKREQAQLANSSQTSLHKILEKRAQNIEKSEGGAGADPVPEWIARLQAQHKCSLSDPKTDEFYRVHARVVCSARPLEVPTDSSSRRPPTSPEDEDLGGLLPTTPEDEDVD